MDDIDELKRKIEAEKRRLHWHGSWDEYHAATKRIARLEGELSAVEAIEKAREANDD